MKACPTCHRTYTDETLNFCLDDGEWLLDGPRTLDESSTVALHSRQLPGEAPTRIIDQPLVSAKYRAEAAEADNPANRKKLRNILLIVGLLVLVIAAVPIAYRYYPNKTRPEINSIAVLPFENGSSDTNLDYLSDGISESVIDRLSQLDQLKVIARSSSFQYKGPNLNLKDVANALGVQAIVTGRIVQRGDNYIIRVDVMDAGENKQLWGENFTRKAGDVQALQTDIAGEIADNLRLRVSGRQADQLAAQGTMNPQAYELLLKGRFYASHRGPESDKKAVEYYEQAVALDPNYALAYAYLGGGYDRLSISSQMDPKIAIPKAEAAIKKALELDDSLAEAHRMMAALRSSSWEWTASEIEYKRAIELNPNYSSVHISYSVFLSFVGRHEEAIVEARRGKELDPLSPSAGIYVPMALLRAREYDQAETAVRSLSGADQNFIHFVLGSIYSAKGMYREAIKAIRKFKSSWVPHMRVQERGIRPSKFFTAWRTERIMCLLLTWRYSMLV